MKQEFETHKGKFLAVKMPKDSFGHWIDPVNIGYMHYHTPHLEGMSDIDVHTVKLDDLYEVIGLKSKLTEEQAVEIVDYKAETNFYLAYNTDLGFIWNTAVESLDSLFRSIKCWTVNPFPEIRKATSEFKKHDFDIMSQFINAKVRTGEWLILKLLENDQNL